MGVTRAKRSGECVETAGRSGRSGKGFKKEGGYCGIWNLEFAVDGCRCVCYQSETQRGVCRDGRQIGQIGQGFQNGGGVLRNLEFGI